MECDHLESQIVLFTRTKLPRSVCCGQIGNGDQHVMAMNYIISVSPLDLRFTYFFSLFSCSLKMLVDWKKGNQNAMEMNCNICFTPGFEIHLFFFQYFCVVSKLRLDWEKKLYGS